MSRGAGRHCMVLLVSVLALSCEQPRNTRVPEQTAPPGQSGSPVSTERGGGDGKDAAMDPARVGAVDGAEPAPGEQPGGMECPEGEHICDGKCVLDDDVMTCGTLCSPCPAPEGGLAECRAGTCFSKCPEGQRDCQARCIDEGSPCGGCSVGENPCNGVCTPATSLEACGSTCKPCPTDPNGNGTAKCDGTSCDLVCNAGYHRCGDVCASDADPKTCGSRCDPCPDSGGRATCVGGLCDFECPGGRKCNGGCVAMDAACGEMCADGYTFCTGRCLPNAQVPKEVCDGKDNDCDGEVDEGNLTRQCRSACGTGTERCDGRGGWTGCTAGQPANENCGNGRDDDCDGRTDCADSDCRAGTSCGSNRFCIGAQCAACTENQSCSPGGNANPCKNYARRCSDGSGACVESGNRNGTCNGNGICQNGQCMTCGGGQKLCGTRCQDCCDGETRGCQNNCQERGTERCSGGQWGSCSAARKQCCGNNDCNNGFRCEGNGSCSTNTCANQSQRVCGGRCVSCPSVTNGQVGCNGNNCVLTGCTGDFYRCGETCVRNGTRCGNSCGTGFRTCGSGCAGTGACCDSECTFRCDANGCRTLDANWRTIFVDNGQDNDDVDIEHDGGSTLTFRHPAIPPSERQASLSGRTITWRTQGLTLRGNVSNDGRTIDWPSVNGTRAARWIRR